MSTGEVNDCVNSNPTTSDKAAEHETFAAVQAQPSDAHECMYTVARKTAPEQCEWSLRQSIEMPSAHEPMCGHSGEAK